MTYPYILPPLPYAPAALEPNLGRSSVRLHHDAFFAAYVDRLNGALVPWTQYQDWPLERLLLALVPAAPDPGPGGAPLWRGRV